MQYVRIMLVPTLANALTVMKDHDFSSLIYFHIKITLNDHTCFSTNENIDDQVMGLNAATRMNVMMLISVHNMLRAKIRTFRTSAFVMKDIKVMVKNVMMLMNVS